MLDRPSKRARLLSDDEDSDHDDSDSSVGGQHLKINNEFAKRFEHNKKREEMQRLEEKYGKNVGQDEEEDEDDSSEDESEDSDAELVTQELDAEIMDTLKALRSKDPRVYDKHHKFYKTPIEEATASTDASKGASKRDKTKPVHLRDYQRQNLLNGNAATEEDDVDGKAPRPMTYTEEQDALKQDLVKQMHTADDDEDEDEDDDFLVKKPGQKEQAPKEMQAAIDEAAIAAADKDPIGYLDKFMQSRAWIPTESSRMQPFESDDDDDADDVADEFEHAYNMRFEDPAHANEKLLSHSRSTAKQYSVRRDDLTGRQKARQREREQKDAIKRQQREEKQRLRNLKLEAAQHKLEKFKEAAGLRKHTLTDEAWEKFMNADWDNGKWEEEMARQFDDEYYQAGDGHEDSDEDGGSSSKKPKKPRWDDDIDIGDIVPDFDEEEKREASKYKLSDDDDGGGVELNGDAMDVDDAAAAEEATATSKSKKHKNKEAEEQKREQKRQARIEKMRLEEIVEQQLNDESLLQESKASGGFRYRETSPGSYGLSAHEILMADDTQLNSFVGLKKLAAYRDEDKKAKDKKKLGKKDRLRKWRKETFGDSHGPQMSFQQFLASRMPAEGKAGRAQVESNIVEGGDGKRKKKHRGGKKRKAGDADE